MPPLKVVERVAPKHAQVCGKPHRLVGAEMVGETKPLEVISGRERLPVIRPPCKAAGDMVQSISYAWGYVL